MNLLDWDQFLERVERNECLALELAEDLLASIDGRVGKLSDAFDSMLSKPIEQAAHALRGLVAPYGGLKLLALLKQIEEEARAGLVVHQSLPDEISLMVNALKTEIHGKLEQLRGTRPSQQPGSDQF